MSRSDYVKTTKFNSLDCNQSIARGKVSLKGLTSFCYFEWLFLLQQNGPIL